MTAKSLMTHSFPHQMTDIVSRSLPGCNLRESLQQHRHTWFYVGKTILLYTLTVLASTSVDCPKPIVVVDSCNNNYDR